MTDEKRQDLIKALLEEKRGYVLHGNEAAAAGVDDELARIGALGKTPQKRASKRVTEAAETR